MSNNAEKEIGKMAEKFKALSNPNRLQIFLTLMECCRPGETWCDAGSEKACVGDLGRELDIVPSTVSHHIKELSRAGLIQTARRGQTVDCWVEPEILAQLSGFFAAR